MAWAASSQGQTDGGHVDQGLGQPGDPLGVAPGALAQPLAAAVAAQESVQSGQAGQEVALGAACPAASIVALP